MTAEWAVAEEIHVTVMSNAAFALERIQKTIFIFISPRGDS